MLRTAMSSTGRLSYHLTKKGQLNLAGGTAASKRVAEELLLRDANEHHCFFRRSGFHNHLSHHILAAYDLGAPPELLKKIYASEAEIQRPIFIEEDHKTIVVGTENWVQYLGNQDAYAAYIKFFSEEIAKSSVTDVLEKYVFDEEVNVRGTNMLARLLAGALHPLIGIGYGVEFGIDTLVATNLAETCVNNINPDNVLQIDKSLPPSQTLAISLLELLRRIYGAELLKPVAYNPDTLISDRIKQALSNGRKEELERLCALYYIPDNISPADLENKIEEILFVATLLLSGTGRKGRKPRLDFFLMHVVTSSLFLKPICGVLRSQEHKAALLRAFVPSVMLLILSRGRPRIDAELAMSYTLYPRPPTFRRPSGTESSQPSSEAIGNPWVDEEYNPWLSLTEGCLYHSDSHVPKTLRTLCFAARQYGDRPAGSVPGAWRNTGSGSVAEETHAGLGLVDGTVFVRAAGVMLDTLGWSGHGQKEGEWDRSALGWDAAWESGD